MPIPSVILKDIVRRARKRLGAPYVWAAKPKPGSPPGSPTDCSGLVSCVYRELGLSIPDGSYNQAKACVKVAVKDVAKVPGALLFKRKLIKPWSVGHVGIVTGEGTVVEANGYYGKVIERVISAGKWSFGGLVKGIHTQT